MTAPVAYLVEWPDGTADLYHADNQPYVSHLGKAGATVTPLIKQPDETSDERIYTKAEAEALCAIAVAGVQHVSALDAARYRWLKAHWYDTPLIGHTDAADLDAIIDSQFADEAIDAEQPQTTEGNKS